MALAHLANAVVNMDGVERVHLTVVRNKDVNPNSVDVGKFN